MSETEKTEDKKTDPAHLFAEQSQRTNDLLEQLIQERKKPAAAPQQQEQQPRIWTLQELQAAVDAGNITNADMVNYLADVKAYAHAKKMREEFSTELANERRRGTVEQKLAAYRASYPELSKRGSELASAVAEAKAELVDEGYDADDLRTELAAYRAVVGQPGKEKIKPVQETTSKRQASVTSAGSSADKGDKGKGSSGDARLPSWLPEKNREFYEREIKKGRYDGKRGEEHLKKELEFLKKKVAAA